MATTKKPNSKVGPLGPWLPERSKKMKITPVQCAHLLERHNERNRPFVESTINRCVTALKHGTWQCNGETIILSSDGQVLDGQDRLKAGLITGITFESYVVFGIDANAMPTIDRGKSRNVAAALAILGEPNYPTLAATLQIVAAYQEGYRNHVLVDAYFDSPDVIRVLEANPSIRDSVSFAVVRRRTGIYCPPRVIAAVHFLIGFPTVPEVLEKRDAFFEQLSSGENLSRNSPILAVRKKFNDMAYNENSRVRRGMGRMTTATYLHALVRAWNAFVADEELSRIQLAYTDGSRRQSLVDLPDIINTRQRKRQESVA